MFETKFKLQDKSYIKCGIGSLIFSGGLAASSMFFPAQEINELKINKLNSDIENLEQDLSEEQKEYLELIEKPDLPTMLPNGSFLPNSTEDEERLAGEIDVDKTLELHSAITLLEDKVVEESNVNEYTAKDYLEIGSACMAGLGIALIMTNRIIKMTD